MNQTLDDYVAGKISPQIALTQFLVAGARTAEIAAALAGCPPHPRVDELRALLVGRERQIEALAAALSATIGDHDASGSTPEDGIARIAGFFDRAVASSPEASVALYSLGDPALLAAATREIVEWLEAKDLLGPEADVLDLGCGIGRVAVALASRCRSVLGLDVSAGMIEEARRRSADLSNVRFERTGGLDLAPLPADGFDLMLAIDSFPYLVQAGASVVERHLGDTRRILRRGGALAILNLSYGRDHAQDLQTATAWAEAFRFRLEHAEARPFRIWDGSAFVLRGSSA